MIFFEEKQTITNFSQLRVKLNTINNESQSNNKPRTNQIEMIFLVGGEYDANKAKLASMITSKFDGLIHLNMSDLLEDRLLSNQQHNNVIENDLKKKTLSIIKNKSELVNDDLVLDTMHQSVQKYSQWKSVRACVVTGYPRNIQQAKDWDKFVEISNFLKAI
jgi:hypothetical protein